MRLSILCFALGVCLLQVQPELPEQTLWSGGIGLLGLLGLVGLVGLLPFSGRHVQSLRVSLRLLFPVAAFVLGFFWAAGFAQYRLDESLADADEGRDVTIVGVVSGLPQLTENGLKFDFFVEQPPSDVSDAHHFPRHLSLAWYRGWRRETQNDINRNPAVAGSLPPLHTGERWQLTVRLKRPHGNVNPHGFDYEAWLLEAGIRATGYVRPAATNRRLNAFIMTPASGVDRLREDIRSRFEQRLVGRPYTGILTALVIGDQRAIDATQWRLFSRTGITHLISISGLHVTMLAGLAYALVNFLWRRQPRLLLYLPAQRAAALGGFLAALVYCLIAGYAVPAQRTLYMLGVVAVALWTGRTTSASRVLLLALLVVLLLDPWAVLMAGFWLSFGAVGLLFYVGSGRLGTLKGVSAWMQTQWAVTLGTLPILLLLFQQFSLVSPLANAIAIPVVSFIITPLALAASVPFLDFLLEPAYWVTQLLMQYIHWLAALPWAVWQQHEPPLWVWMGALAGCCWLLLPRGFPARSLGLVMLLPLIFVVPQRPEPGSVRLTVLDVGQGLAIHIQTAQHDLLYDTGPLYTEQANAGNRVIVPYLRASGVAQLDGLIVTHQDTDHSGGAESVVDEMPVGWLMSSLEFEHPFSALPLKALPCVAGQQWTWEGVRFSVLHPLATQLQEPVHKTNDVSCVLMVETDRARVLLPSDIEAVSERALLAREGHRLHADVLVVPHHGSRTSSTAEFIATVGAMNIIFPVGYRNHFHHPHPDVVERYRASGAQLHRTDTEGALTLSINPTGEPLKMESARAARWRYWYGR